MPMLAGYRPSNAREIRAMLVESRGDGSEALRPDRIALLEQAIREGKIGLDPTGTRYSPHLRAQKTIRLKELAEAFLGEGWAREMERLSLVEQLNLMEAPAAVTSKIFPKVISQLLFSEIRRQFEVEANVFSPLFPVIPSDIVGQEIVPSITRIDPDDLRDVAEAQSYPRVGVTEEYFTLPAKQKRGGIIELTREAVRLDRTGLLVDQSREVGSALGAARENACIDVLIGQVNNYIRLGSASNTYLTAGSYVNRATSAPLNDWTDVDAALQLLAEIPDPNTGEPIAANLNPRHLVVMPRRLMTARRILSATETRGDANETAGTRSEVTIAENPLSGLNLQLLTSQRLYHRVLRGPESEAAKAQAGWFIGSIDEAFAWYEVWPLEVMQQGRESHDSFDRDIEMKFKASYFGVAAVREPRKIARFEDSAWS